MNKKVVILILVVLVLIMLPIGSYLKEQITIKKISSSNKPDETISGDNGEEIPIHVEMIKDDPNVDTVNIDGFEIPVDYKFADKSGITSSFNINVSAVAFKTKDNMTKINVYFTSNSELPIDKDSEFLLALTSDDGVNVMQTSLPAFLFSGDTILKGEKGIATTQFSIPLKSIDKVKVTCDNYVPIDLDEVLNPLLS